MRKELKDKLCILRNHALLTVAAMAALLTAQAQPNLISVVPADGSTGISPTASVVFTFDTPMDTTQTSPYISDFARPYTIYSTTEVWSDGDTILTCTPATQFEINQQILWSLSGTDTNGNSLSGNPIGSFRTSAGGAGTGSGTNRFTTCSIGEIYSYDQFSAGGPTLNTSNSYLFFGGTALASNRTANSVTVLFPTGGTSNLVQDYSSHENYNMFGTSTNLSSYNATFPSGAYLFTISATASNQPVSVNLPATMLQPNAPHLTNFAAAQAVNPAQPFTFYWDPFTGGATTDFVYVIISGAGGDVFATTNVGLSGALNGTATSVQVPAGTLSANTDYTGSLGFYRAITTTNGTTATLAYKATVTEFAVTTGAAIAPAPVVTNVAWTNGISFDVHTLAGQKITVVYSTNLPASPWQVLFTTNSPGSLLHVYDARSRTNRSLFYRVRNGT